MKSIRKTLAWTALAIGTLSVAQGCIPVIVGGTGAAVAMATDSWACAMASGSFTTLRAGITRGPLTVDAFVLNAFDDDNYVAGFQGSVLTPTFSLSGSENYAILGLPDLRTYGARVSYKF